MCNEHKRWYTKCLQYIINRSQLMILKYSKFTEAYLTMKRQVENNIYLEDTWRGGKCQYNQYNKLLSFLVFKKL